MVKGGNKGAGKMTPAIMMAFLKSFGMDAGWGGGKGRGKGGRSSGGSFVKNELVNKIKEFQRSSEENKQAWWTFCDSQELQKRDPALHEEDVLQAFLADHGIQGVQGTKTEHFIKQELINKIKTFQRSSEEQKQAWWSFCDQQEGQNHDPARYEIAVLRAFVAEHGIPGVKGNKKQKDMLVAKIKGFQKASEEQKQAWWAFCDSQEGTNKDPARYDVDALQSFIRENGI
jgi:hypothetical protein